jgi:hypothetical protein
MDYWNRFDTCMHYFCQIISYVINIINMEIIKNQYMYFNDICYVYDGNCFTLPWYNWNIVESGIKHHNPKPPGNCLGTMQIPVYNLASVVCKLFTFQASSPKPLGRLEPNLARMFLGWSSTKLLFFVLVGYSIWLPGPIMCSDWLKFQRSSSLKLMNW